MCKCSKHLRVHTKWKNNNRLKNSSPFIPTKNGRLAPWGVIVQIEILQGLQAINSPVFICLCIMGLLPECGKSPVNFDHTLYYLTCHCQSSVSVFSPFSPHYLLLPLHNPLFIRSEIYIVPFFVFQLFFKGSFRLKWVTNWWTFPIKCSGFIYLFLLRTWDFVLACCSWIHPL